MLTEGEIKALANIVRIVRKLTGNLPYVQKLFETGGDTAFDKLMEKVKEINKAKGE
jgi:hypothetical protein